MVRYSKTIVDGYITQVSSADLKPEFYIQNEISEIEYNTILEEMNSHNNADGVIYRLREDMTWESEMLQPPSGDDELTIYEAACIILGV